MRFPAVAFLTIKTEHIGPVRITRNKFGWFWPHPKLGFQGVRDIRQAVTLVRNADESRRPHGGKSAKELPPAVRRVALLARFAAALGLGL